MNRNGVIGEPADTQVADGVTADPDGDGVNEDIIYVDAVIGSDAGPAVQRRPRDFRPGYTVAAENY